MQCQRCNLAAIDRTGQAQQEPHLQLADLVPALLHLSFHLSLPNLGCLQPRLKLQQGRAGPKPLQGKSIKILMGAGQRQVARVKMREGSHHPAPACGRAPTCSSCMSGTRTVSRALLAKRLFASVSASSRDCLALCAPMKLLSS